MLVLVPILWFALYGSRTEMAITVAAVSLTFVGPILIIGAPPSTTPPNGNAPPCGPRQP